MMVRENKLVFLKQLMEEVVLSELIRLTIISQPMDVGMFRTTQRSMLLKAKNAWDHSQRHVL